MRKLLVFLCLVGLVTSATASVALAASPVEYTWTLAALGQGGWIGGPLFADGTAGGGGNIAVGNGSSIINVRPTSWSEPQPELIDICFTARTIKGDGPATFSFCLSDPPTSTLLPVTGTPVKVDLPGLGPHIVRVTELH
jgi:hypothetical protein